MAYNKPILADNNDYKPMEFGTVNPIVLSSNTIVHVFPSVNLISDLYQTVIIEYSLNVASK